MIANVMEEELAHGSNIVKELPEILLHHQLLLVIQPVELVQLVGKIPNVQAAVQVDIY